VLKDLNFFISAFKWKIKFISWD